MKKTLKEVIILIIITSVLISCAAIVHRKKIDIPLLGDSATAFIIRSADYSAADYRTYSKKEIIYDAAYGKIIYIVNPSPQKYVLKLTNTKTNKTFRVKRRDTLKDNNYIIKRLLLDGKIISEHELTIVR